MHQARAEIVEEPPLGNDVDHDAPHPLQRAVEAVNGATGTQHSEVAASSHPEEPDGGRRRQHDQRIERHPDLHVRAMLPGRSDPQ